MIPIKELPKTERNDFFLLDENHYIQQMKAIVEPHLTYHMIKGRFRTDVSLYYELFPMKENKGTVVICHGFTETAAKFHEWIYNLMRQGYQVAIMEHRGHGYSQRQVPEKDLVHVDHFEDYVTDFHAFVHRIVLQKMKVDPGRFYLYGHSMGGCISARYIETYPDDFAKCILNAPMMGIDFGKLPLPIAKAMCLFNMWTGRGLHHITGQGLFNVYPDFNACSATSRPRYYYYHRIKSAQPKFQTSRASWKWGWESIKAGEKACRVEEVNKIRIPVMMFVAERDGLVSRPAQMLFLSRFVNGKAYLVKGSKHEIYGSQNEILKDYLAAVTEFYDNYHCERSVTR